MSNKRSGQTTVRGLQRLSAYCEANNGDNYLLRNENLPFIGFLGL